MKPPPIVVALVLAFALTIALGACGTTEGPATTSTSASTTTTAPRTSTTAAESTTSTSSAPTSTSTTSLAGPPGDSPGAWVEVELPEIAGRATWVALSDVALLVQTDPGETPTLKAYLLDSAQLVELPAESSLVSAIDIDGNLAVWVEGRYDESTDTFEDHYLFAYALPDGPKVKVTGEEQAPFYPQVAPGWISWMEMGAEDPSGENRELRILGIEVDASGNPVGQPVEFVPSAVATSGRGLSLDLQPLEHEAGLGAASGCRRHRCRKLPHGSGHSRGEQDRRRGVASVASWGPRRVLGGRTQDPRDVDRRRTRSWTPVVTSPAPPPASPRISALPTTVGTTSWPGASRARTSRFSARASEPPWLASSIAVSDHYVAFIVDGSARLFRWQAKA